MVKVWDVAGMLVATTLRGFECVWRRVVPCFSAALPILQAPAREVHGWFVCLTTTMYHRFLMGYKQRQRKRLIITESSRRTQRVLDILDVDELGGDELELIERRQYIRCAVLISRRARMGLKFPSYSAANERIAADWILKHLPDDMTIGVRHKVLPLAVKLTFVRSTHELRANYHFNVLKDMVDFGSH